MKQELILDSKPLRHLKTTDMFTGLSSNSVAAFTALCHEDAANSHHLSIKSDAPMALGLIPDNSIQLAFSRLSPADMVNYPPDVEFAAKLETGSLDKSIEDKTRGKELLKALFPKVKQNGSVVIEINISKHGGRGIIGMIFRLAEEVGFTSRREDIWVMKNHVHENACERSRLCDQCMIILDKFSTDSCDRGKLTTNGIPNNRSIFGCQGSRANYGHPATFHPALPEHYIHTMTQLGDTVLDLTAGIATTALAAMKLSRNSISIESHSKYQGKSIKRLLYFATDFDAKVYVPATFDIFSDTEPSEPVRAHQTEAFPIERADTDYMASSNIIAPEKQLVTTITTPANMKTPSPFPLESLSQFQQELVDDLVSSSKANEIVAATSVLTTWSAALGRSWTALDRTRNAIDYPNLHVLILAPTGAGKSVSDKIAKPIVKAESIAHRIRRSLGENELPHYIYDTMTNSALIELLLRSEDTGFLFSSEAGGLINSLLRQSRGTAGNLFELLLKSFAVERHRDHTMKHGTRSPIPCMAQLLLAQPKIARALIANEDFEERGLANRWLLAETPRPPLQYETNEIIRPNPNVHRTWHQLILKAMRSRIIGSKKTTQHVWSEAALDLFRDYRNQLTSKLKSEWSGYDTGLFERSRELHKRIALCLLASEFHSGDESILEYDHVAALRAYEIIHWFDERRIEIMTAANQDKSTTLKRRVLDILMSAPKHQISLRDLARRHNISKEQIEDLVRLFNSHFEIKRIHPKGGKAGRKSDVLCLKLSA